MAFLRAERLLVRRQEKTVHTAYEKPGHLLEK
jgi:hypothetical protein